MITVEHLTKRYGDFTAVQDLNFTIEEGHVYGFLGPNGAGKSTTMNIMTGCLSATEGTVSIDGYDIFEEPNEAKRRIGYLPEQPPLYLNESPVEYLRFVGEAKGLRGERLQEQIADVIAQTGIDEVKNRRISSLSKGYRQRVGIAQALLGDPKVIILDEPTVGLDPIQIIEIRDLIRELGKTHTVIFSSHILQEVQSICDQILMIAHGRLVAFDKPEALERQMHTSNELTLTAEATPEEVQSVLESVDVVESVSVLPGEDPAFTTANLITKGQDIRGAASAVFRAFAQSDHALVELTPHRASLEDVFLELTEGAQETSASVPSLTETAQSTPPAKTPAQQSVAADAQATRGQISSDPPDAQPQQRDTPPAQAERKREEDAP